MTTRTTITRFTELNLPETDEWIEVPWEQSCCVTDVHVEARDDGSRLVRYAVDDGEDPGRDLVEWDDFDTDPSEWYRGVFRDFRDSRDGGGQEERDAFYADAVEKVGEDHVFVVEVYSHGNESFSVVGAKWYPDRRWDVCPACVFVAPPDATDPRAYADAAMEEWTSWCNGDVYGLVEIIVQPDGTAVEGDSVWGLIGWKYAEQMVATGY